MSDNTIDGLLDKNKYKEILDLYKKVSKNDEFELIFYASGKTNRRSFEYYKRILEYMNYRSRSNKLDIIKEDTLDINYFDRDENIIYRITINGLESINKYITMLRQKKNHVIFRVIIDNLNDKNITALKKIRSHENVIDIYDFDMKIKMAREEELTKKDIDYLKKLPHEQANLIGFRYKQRVTLKLDKNMNIDLTNIRMAYDVNKIEKSFPMYELEIEIMNSNDKKLLDMMFAEATLLYKVINQTNYIMTQTNANDIIDKYSSLLNLDKSKLTGLAVRNAYSIQTQHIVDNLPNKYAVTDKADGDRYLLVIFDRHVYLISIILGVRFTGIVLKDDKYNNTILDGEYIFLPKKNRHLFLIFDCLFRSGDDIRSQPIFMERLKVANDLVNECFIFGKQKGFKFENNIQGFDIKKLLDFYDKDLKRFMDNLNNDIELEKKLPLIRTKYFIPVLGGQDNEIFKYSVLMWNKYVYDEMINCPYVLDGLVYHPLDQKYTLVKADTRHLEYKWKPENKTSFDFYVEFEKDKKSGKVHIVFDNSKSNDQKEYREDDVEEDNNLFTNKPYKIANLYVGRQVGNREEPVLFQEGTNYNVAHLYLENGEVRDSTGTVIQDKTVVEFYYNNDPNIPDTQRWIPMRTRYDKTESIYQYGKKYGNYIETADKIWQTVQNPVLMNDFVVLSVDEQYEKHIDILRSKVGHSVIMTAAQENSYFQKITNLAKNMRSFHNWITSNLLYTYCSSKYEYNKPMTILDMACGRGRNLMKFYYGKVNKLVGFDIDINALISPVDGAWSRYNQMKKKNPRFPEMIFIQADGGAILDYDEQIKVLGSMSNQNKQYMQKVFSKDPKKRTMFDRLNCTFAFHYFLSTETVFNNMLENINMYMKPGGLLTLETTDADEIVKLFKDRDQYTSYYTDNEGKQEVLFDIVKKYDEKNFKDGVIGVGNGIDFYNAIISNEGKYITEYLVQKEFLVSQLEEKCGLELLETDLYVNSFFIQENFLLNYSQFEATPQTKKFFGQVSEFYNMKDEVNKASFLMMKLNRFYVFRKK